MSASIAKFLRAREIAYLNASCSDSAEAVGQADLRPAPNPPVRLTHDASASDLRSRTATDPMHGPTGPKTPEGKAISSMNALKHGLTSTKVVLPGEDPAEFVSFRDQLISEQSPVGELETTLVHELAAAIWRLRRIREHETNLLENADSLFDGSNEQAGRGFDRLLRYMGSAERQLYRVQSQLERAQKQRRNLEDQKRYRPILKRAAGEKAVPGGFVSSEPSKATSAAVTTAAGFVSPPAPPQFAAAGNR